MTHQPTLSGLQYRILTFIRTYTQDNGFPPTLREIGANVGLASTSSVHHQLRILGDKGYVSRVGSRSRAIRVRFPGEDAA